MPSVGLLKKTGSHWKNWIFGQKSGFLKRALSDDDHVPAICVKSSEKKTFNFFKNFFYGFMAYFAILVKRKNVRFSVHTLRFGSVVSQGHFFGDPDSLTKFHRNFLENNKCLYVKNWRKRTTFYSRFRSQVGTPRFQNVIFGPFWAILGQFWAFLGHLGPFRVILGIFFVILGHFRPFWDTWGHIWAILGHFGSLTKINWSDVFFFAGIWWGFFCRPTAYISCRESVEKNTSNCPVAPGVWFGQPSRSSKRFGFNK